MASFVLDAGPLNKQQERLLQLRAFYSPSSPVTRCQLDGTHGYLPGREERSWASTGPYSSSNSRPDAAFPCSTSSSIRSNARARRFSALCKCHVEYAKTLDQPNHQGN